MSKRIFYIPLFILSISLTAVSCKKEKGICGDGNLCFNLNGEDVSVTAVRKYLPNNRFRLYWEGGTTDNSKTVEVDIFGNTSAEYTITNNAGTAGDAGFQYYMSGSTQTISYYGVSGTLKLTSIANEKWTGTFEGIASDGNATFELKNGKFSEVPLE